MSSHTPEWFSLARRRARRWRRGIRPTWLSGRCKAQGELCKALDLVFNENQRAKDVVTRVKTSIDSILKNG